MQIRSVRNLIFLGAVSIMFTSCYDRKISNPSLLHAEALIDTSPLSSFHILNSLFLNELSRAEQMCYALLWAEANDKNAFALLPCDSLLDEALAYYDNGIDRAKALLYKGRILVEMNLDEDALKCYFDALKEVGETDKGELKIKGMLYEDIGNLYLKQSLFDKAAKAFSKAEACFVKCEYVPGVSSVHCNMGWLLLTEGDTVNARRYMKQSLKPVRCSLDSLATAVFYHNLSCTFEDMDSVLFYAKQSLALDGKSSIKSAIMVGYAYLNKEQTDSAEYYFRYALNDKLTETRALAYYGLKDLMEAEGDYRQALEYFNDYSMLMDSIYFYRESSQLERKSYEYMAELKFYKDRIRFRAWLLGVGTAIFLLGLGFILRMVYLRRMRRLQYEYEEAVLQAAISDLQYRMVVLRQQHEKAKELLSQKELELQNSFDEKAKLYNVIFKETKIYKRIQELGDIKKGKEKVKIQVLINEEQAQLRTTVKEIYKDYISNLKHNYPQYTEDDCIFACLSLLGLDDATLALCFGNFDTRIIVQRRYRMKKKAGINHKEHIVTYE